MAEQQQGSPGWWLMNLEPKLIAQARAAERYRRYYRGQHRLAFATAKFREAFGLLFAALADNWMQIVVDASVERLVVTGFKFEDPAESDETSGADTAEADDAAWEIWQANNLDSGSIQAHTEAVKCGTAYTLVSPPAQPGGMPLITIEHPCQMYVQTSAENRRQRLAALKRWQGEDGYAYATLYLPDQIVKWQSENKLKGAGAPISWIARREDPGGANPLGEVPVIPFENNPDLITGGVSDIDVVMALQDAINKLCSDMLLASEYQAYRQRILTGVELPTDPNTGETVRSAELKAAMSRLWAFADPDAKVYDLPPADLSNIEKAIEMFVRHLGAQTRTPPYYFAGQMVNIAAEGLKASETGLITKCRRKTVDFSDRWEDTLRLAFKAKGDTTRARYMGAETLWGNLETRTLGELADALVKLQTLGIPAEVLWGMYGFSPQEVKRMLAQRGLPDRTTPPAGDNPAGDGGANGNGAGQPAPIGGASN